MSKYRYPYKRCSDSCLHFLCRCRSIPLRAVSQRPDWDSHWDNHFVGGLAVQGGRHVRWPLVGTEARLLIGVAHLLISMAILCIPIAVAPLLCSFFNSAIDRPREAWR